MREYIFRGKSYTDDKWHYGYYMFRPATAFTAERHEIVNGAGLGWNCLQETIGMFTGREAYKGDNKVKLFEGDRCILTLFDYNGLDTQYECAVEWCGGCFAFVNEEKGIFVPLCNVEDTDSDVEVVGTIYDKEAK